MHSRERNNSGKDGEQKKENESGITNQALRLEISTLLCKDRKGYTIELTKMLKYTEDCFNKKLIEASKTMQDKVAPKAY